MTDAAETQPVQDLCLTFLLHDGAVRGRVVRLDRTLTEILDRHQYPQPVAHLLAEMASLAVVLAFAMKFDGVFTLQAQGDGPLRMMVADVTSDGAVRASASFDQDAIAALCAKEQKPSLHQMVGTGRLVFTVDLEGTMEGATNRYQGIVPLEDPTLGESIHRYFRQSEQLETAVKVATRLDPAAGWLGGAVMVQRMPRIAAEVRSEEELDDLWRTAVVLLSSLTDDELLDPALSPQDVLYRLYHMENLGVAAESRPLHFACRCSRDKVALALRSFTEQDFAEMKQQDGTIAAQCQFCSTDYVFTESDIAGLKDH
jgi:molecular chaperone Hsp33